MGGLLVLEGPKGVGKTTVVNALRMNLSDAQGGRVLLTKEPTAEFDLDQEAHLLGSRLAQAIALDRARHVKEVISPALDAGKVVICDRYVLSSLVFHSADGVSAEEIWLLNQTFPLPDVNFLLTASPVVIDRRLGGRSVHTRLEGIGDPGDESDKYLHFGRGMQNRGSQLKIISNETPEELQQALTWIMHFIESGLSI
jgi:dTMP kinase